MALEAVRPINTRPHWLALEPRKEIFDGNLQGYGDSHQRIDRNVFLSPFNFTNIIWVKVSFFGQFLL